MSEPPDGPRLLITQFPAHGIRLIVYHLQSLPLTAEQSPRPKAMGYHTGSLCPFGAVGPWPQADA